LLEALGPLASRAALELAPGATSDVIRSGAGYLLLRVVERGQGSAPDFAAVRDEVRAEYLRRAGDDRLREALVGLRAATDVRVRGR
jgi:parvulin-like peptidyl-prolyl isomerase